jgi:hypothetical protein
MTEIFNPADILNNLQTSNLDPNAFERVDDRDISKAPNFLEWVIGPKYLNNTILPFQVGIGAKLFAEYCPYCSKPGYIDTLFDQSIGNIRDNIQFLEHGICTKCNKNRWEIQSVNHDLNYYNELVACLGQRSGKSILTGLIATYVLHRYLKIPNPTRLFNQPTGSMLTGTFSSLTAGQAERNLWSSFRGTIQNSPWFSEYHRFLKARGKELGSELIEERKSFYQYNHKLINFHFTGSQDRVMRGATRIFTAIDELGWFVSDEVKEGELQSKSADGVYNALSNSLSTMRNKYTRVFSPEFFDIPTAIMVNVSSPSAAKDKMMRLLKDSTKNTRILAAHNSTWLSNPDYTYEGLRLEYSHMDEKTFMRDFGAQPPLASDPFLEDPQYIDSIAVEEPYANLSHIEVVSKDAMGGNFKSAKAIFKNSDPNLPRMITFDLARTDNCLAFCLFSLNKDGKPRLDYALSLKPEKGLIVNMTNFFDEFTLPLCANLNIKHAVFDRWQSFDQVQRLRDKKIDARVVSLKYADMATVRSQITGRSVTIPKLTRPMKDVVEQYLESENDLFLFKEPVSMLGIQLLTSRDLGTKMAKPVDGDDDLFRAFCLGVHMFQDPAVIKQYTAGARTIDGGQTARALGSLHLRGASQRGEAGPSNQSNQFGTVRSRMRRQN